APCQTIHFAHFAGGAQHLRIIFVESVVDTAQNRFQRDTCFAPGFDESPIQRGKHQQGTASSLEPLLDFGKIIEIVQHCALLQLKPTQSSTPKLGSTLPVSIEIAFVDETQPSQ